MNVFKQVLPPLQTTLKLLLITHTLTHTNIITIPEHHHLPLLIRSLVYCVHNPTQLHQSCLPPTTKRTTPPRLLVIPKALPRQLPTLARRLEAMFQAIKPGVLPDLAQLSLPAQPALAMDAASPPYLHLDLAATSASLPATSLAPLAVPAPELYPLLNQLEA